jgi:hypothetical protein
MPTIRVPFAITARPSADAGASVDVPVVGPTTFDKVFSTEPLIGSSVVEMVSVLGAGGPLAYVAMERVEGSLDGESGAFALRHVGSIVDGVAVLTLDVVEGSGTRDLAGLSGIGSIEHTGDGAFLTLTYSLPG